MGTENRFDDSWVGDNCSIHQAIISTSSGHHCLFVPFQSSLWRVWWFQWSKGRSHLFETNKLETKRLKSLSQLTKTTRRNISSNEVLGSEGLFIPLESWDMSSVVSSWEHVSHTRSQWNCNILNHYVEILIESLNRGNRKNIFPKQKTSDVYMCEPGLKNYALIIQ